MKVMNNYNEKLKEFYCFDKIYIENAQKNHPNIQRILTNITGSPIIEYVDDLYDLIKRSPVIYHPQERAKQLYLGSIRGDIVRKCPGTHGHLCCNYYVINLYIGCPINCSYCILQSYLNQPFTIINIDLETIFNELNQIAKINQKKIYRIGTGELGDSLIYDNLTGFSRDFIQFFVDKSNFFFEFKTKTNLIDNLLQFNSPGNIVVGFSVNPQDIICQEESYSAAIEDRLIAAKKLIKNGYKIALHFDPIMNIPDFMEQYNSLIQLIFKYITPDNIAWISLGTFRYTPDLKNKIEYNYPESKILTEEFLENHDRKFRYFKPIRIKLYSQIITWLKQYSRNLLIYLCMESPYVWQNTLGYLPYSEDKMAFIFKQAMMNKR